jgi:uncharacterized delta-60 repeat protein
MFSALLLRPLARHVLVLVFALAGSAAALVAQTPSAIDGFDPNCDGNIYTTVTQPDGRILVGGQFSSFRTRDGFNITRNNLARLNTDGSLDTSFNPNANGPVRSIALQSDGKIVVGGDFTSLQPAGATATARGRLARLNADGSLDTTFNPNVSGTLQPQVYAVLVQADGKIVAGGTFTTVQPNATGAVTARNYLARFNANGTLDTAYNPNPNGIVLALATHLSSKIVVGGGFTTFQENGKPNATTRNRIARLNTDGTVDSEFNPNANNGVTCIAVQRDGKVVFGGYFTTIQPIGNDSTANTQHVARLNPDGTIDSEFSINTNGNVYALAVQPDGSLLLGGSFSTVWSRGSITSTRNNVARFAPGSDALLDAGFDPGLNAEVDAFAFQLDGKVVIGGKFTRAQPAGSSVALIRNRLVRLNQEGSVDATLQLDAAGRVLASVQQPDGKIVIAGSFTSVGGATHDYVARLNADGSVDSTFNPDFNGRVFTLVLQSDGKVIVGGDFTTIGGETRNHLARLNPIGTIDSEFNPNIDGQVGVIALQSDGKILVGGSFNNVQPIGATTFAVRPNLLRLTTTGTLDTAFHPNPNSSISALAVQSDGKILVAGGFTAFTPDVDLTPVTTTTNGTTTTTSPTGTTVAANFFTRLNADGTIDTAFNALLDAQVSAIVVQSDGKIVLGGGFNQVHGTGATATTTPTTRHHLARFNADGTIDTTFDPNANGNVLALTLQSDGKLLIGGTFTTLQPNAATDWTLRKYTARLNADGTVDSTFNLDLNEEIGNRVDSITLQRDGRILLGGSFLSLQPAGSSARVERKYFARINTNGTLDTSFDPAAGGATGATINAMVLQPDGKFVVGGAFSDLGGAKTTNIARFNAEGTPDTAFTPSLTVNGPINAIVVRPNGAPVPTPVAGFAWLNRDGSLNPAFATAPGGRLSGTVNAIAFQSDGSLLLGGAFTNLDNTTTGNLVRFSARGVLDTNFNPAPDGPVYGMALDASGRIVIVGAFTNVGGNARNHVARLNADGSVDGGFDPNANAVVNALVMQGDGKIVIGGVFTSLTPNGAATATTLNYLARINQDGTLDANYNPAPNSGVNALLLQPDGKVVAGGTFTQVQPNGATTATTRNDIARFNTDGSLDQNFDPNLNGMVAALAIEPDGQIVIGGRFTTVQPTINGTLTTAITRYYIARINSDGAVDLVFNPYANGAVTTVALQSDGSLIIGGEFTTLQANGSSVITRNRLARLNSDGSLDVSFNPDANGAVTSVVAGPNSGVLVGGAFTALQPNGSLMVGGTFTTVGGLAARNLAILNDDGSVNPLFQPQPNGAVNALLVQPDGKVVVGGAFTTIAGATRNRIARFNADGTLDATFNPNADATVNALALQSDGKILVGGVFVNVGGQSRLSLARLNSDGSLDPTLSVSGQLAVVAIAVQSDARFVVVGLGIGTPVVQRYNTNGSPDPTLSVKLSSNTPSRALAVQADGKIIVAATVAGALARFNANGTVDNSFAPAVNGTVTALALQPDGRTLIGGAFNHIGDQQRVGLARLAATDAATQSLTVTSDRRTVTWARAGTAGELSAVIFEVSTNRQTWSPLGIGSRVTAGWQLTGLSSLPASGLFYIRARGIAPTSGGTSSSLSDTVREFNFSSPLAVAASAIVDVTTSTTPPTAAAAPQFVVEPVSGITPLATATNVNGSTMEIVVAGSTITSSTTSARLANLSTRGRVSGGNPLLIGFAISGTEPRAVLLRAIGPSLQVFGVTDALPAARLQLYDAHGALILTNDSWSTTASLGSTFVRTGAFPLTTGSADSAALVTLQPGNYSLQVVDVRGTGGVGLGEIYDAGTGSGSRLTNVSTRGAAGTGSAALLSGFVIAGDTSERVLLRGVGPGLTAFGVTNAASDPAIALYDSTGRALGTNDNWVSMNGTLASAASRSGAFPLAASSNDAAVLATLPPGAYTVQVSNTSGDSTSAPTALLEIYESP